MKNYLVIQGARFGDLVQSKRIILTLAAKGIVHLLLDNSMSSLARMLYPDAEIHGIYFHGLPSPQKNAHNSRIFDRLSDMSFERIFNLNFSLLTSQICRLFDPGQVVGYRPAFMCNAGILRSPWARMAFKLARHRKLTPLNLADFWAYFIDKPVRPEQVNPFAMSRGGGVGVVMAGRDQRRSIPAVFLAKLIETIFNLRNGPRVSLLGTENEKAFSKKLYRFLSASVRQRTVDLCGKTGWKDLLEITASLDAILTPDTGTMHLAAHLGVPVYAFFLSSAWCHETGPYGCGHYVWQVSCDCSPCLEAAVCDKNKICHNAMMSDELLQSFAQVVSGNKNNRLPPQSSLQCWESGLDKFGGLYKLVHGSDPFAGQRSSLRKMLGEYQGLNSAATEASIVENARMWPLLFVDSDWMLPPWRYC